MPTTPLSGQKQKKPGQQRAAGLTKSGGGGNRTRVQSKFHKDIYIVIALFSHYAQSQPIIGVRWATTIFGCLSSLPAVFPASSVMGDSVTRATRSLH